MFRGSIPTPSSLGRSVLKADLRALAVALPPMTAAQQVLAMQRPASSEVEEPEEVVDEVAVAAAHPEAADGASTDMDVDGEIAAAVDIDGL